MSALVGTFVGFLLATVVILLLGPHPALLWISLPVAVFLAGYAPSAISFGAGQAMFVVLVVELFNLMAPGGWEVGVARVEAVAVGALVALSALAHHVAEGCVGGAARGGRRAPARRGHAPLARVRWARRAQRSGRRRCGTRGDTRNPAPRRRSVRGVSRRARRKARPARGMGMACARAHRHARRRRCRDRDAALGVRGARPR